MLIAKILVALVAAIHLYLMYAEMYEWNTRCKKFLSGLDPDTFGPSTILAKNMGLYNGLLGIGLLWSIYLGKPLFEQVATLFLWFIVVAGIFGAVTADRKLAAAQSAPALLGIVAISLSW